MKDSLFRIAWKNSGGLPSRIHLAREAAQDTLCMDHENDLRSRKRMVAPTREKGFSNRCKVCLIVALHLTGNPKLTFPWHLSCKEKTGATP